MRIRAGRQIRHHLQVHLVFVTKAAGPVLDRAAMDDLRGVFNDICRSFDCELLFCGGGTDWVRLTASYPPGLDLTVLVNSLKTVSSRLIRKAPYPGIADALRASGGALWSPSYLAVSGDAQEVEEAVLTFVDEQGGGAML